MLITRLVCLRDVEDASFLRPTYSPFEPLFHSLAQLAPIQHSPSTLLHSNYPVLNSLDLIADHTTLLHIINFLRDPLNQVCRTDCQYTTPTTAVVMHHWLTKIMYGAGDPHRGWVNSYIRRVTAPARVGQWERGTTQMVRYDLEGMRMMVRYPVNAMVGSTDVYGSTSYTFDTKKSTITETTTSTAAKDIIIDRSKFIAIKVISKHFYSTTILDLEDLYLRLVLTQTDRCLIAPHHRSDFNQYGNPPRFVLRSDPLFDDARASVEPLLRQAIGVWRNMVNITRKLGRNVSFVGNEDGSIQVLGMKKGPYEHVNLSKMALGILDDAAREFLSLQWIL
jgi:hypothetical protein